MAKDGRVISAVAGSCTWKKTFFDEWDKGDLDAFWRRYSDHRNMERQARLLQEAVFEGRVPIVVIFP
jgi:hypothetical protein